MAVHSIQPGFIEIQYVYSNILHKMRIPVIPDSGWVIGTNPDLFRKNGALVAMGAAVDEFIAVLKPLFSSSTDFTKAEAWFYPDGVDNPVWVYTHAIGLPGTNAGANVQSSQQVITFRTLQGGIAKYYMMEGVFTPNVRNSYPFGAGVITNLSNYLIGATSWSVGRDNGTLVVPMWATSKTNDAIRKLRLSM